MGAWAFEMWFGKRPVRNDRRVGEQYRKTSAYREQKEAGSELPLPEEPRRAGQGSFILLRGQTGQAGRQGSSDVQWRSSRIPASTIFLM